MYRGFDVALLRAAVAPLEATLDDWPDSTDADACRAWLERVWERPAFVEAVRQASASLAERADAIQAGRVVEARQIRRAAVSVARYALRATGRPTPFGLFAGVAPIGLGQMARVRWGDDHRALTRVSTEWLADVIDGLEACPELLERVEVVWSNLAVRRGRRIELPRAANRVTIRWTPAVDAASAAARAPIGFGVLVERLVEEFPAANQETVRRMLTGLVRQGFLITSLRAPFTVTDPLAHLLDRLVEAGSEDLPATASRVCELRDVHKEVRRHNEKASAWAEQARQRAGLKRRMASLSQDRWTPLAVDVRLDCEVRLPHDVVDEMAQAAGALLRLTRQPAAERAWRDYYNAFCDRYGTETLVPLADVVDPDAGLGYPASYPGSVFSLPPDLPTERDQELLKLAWQAVLDGGREIALTDEQLRALTGEDRLDERIVPPHVELAGRIHAASTEALERGDYTIFVFPARAAGTLTSRFTPVANGSGLEDAYRTLPTVIDGALPVQLSFPPVYPHSENICRVPAYLPHLLPLGEHRASDDDGIVSLDDLAITATRDRLHLVSVSRRQVVEPQVFHALDLAKQPPPLARFLAHLPRAFHPGWLAFDWGPQATRLPYLPQVRYRRCVLTRATWRLAGTDLPPRRASRDEWREALARWREHWRCPPVIDLREPGRTLRLTLDEPVHAELLRIYLDQHDDALLAEAPTAADFGWLDGHSHEVAVPLVPTQPPALLPLRGELPKVTNGAHGDLPGAPASGWLSARVHTHPERLNEIIADWLPVLLAALKDEPPYWFVRYRNQRQTDHLRLRVRTSTTEQHAACVHAVGEWADRLRHQRIAGRLVFDTYRPEVGRYGGDTAAIAAAETVFTADSCAVAAALRCPPVADPTALVVASMVHIVGGLLGSHAAGMRWLSDRPVPTTVTPDRSVAREAINLAGREAPTDLPAWSSEIGQAWDARATALAVYRERLPADADLDGVVESLLHMHHNRAIGIDPGSERVCRRLARQAALAWSAQYGDDR